MESPSDSLVTRALEYNSPYLAEKLWVRGFIHFYGDGYT
tara:strand:- start:3326 stop:3442 length:117 start_codon:yes stop_codon:yes gene_type:complete